jgi:hypothetical protein
MIKLKKRGYTVVQIILGLVIIGLMAYVVAFPVISYVKVHFFNENGTMIWPGSGEFKPYKETYSDEDEIVINSMRAVTKSIDALIQGKNVNKFGISPALKVTIKDTVAIYRYDLTYWVSYDPKGFDWNNVKTYKTRKSGGKPYDEETPIAGNFVIELSKKDTNYKVDMIEVVHNIGLVVHYINLSDDKTWTIEYKTSQVKRVKNEYDTNNAIGAKKGKSCETSPTWIEAPGIKVFYCSKDYDNKEGGTAYVTSLITPCESCTEPKAHIEHEKSHWYDWVLNPFKTIGKAIADVWEATVNFLGTFFGIKVDQPIETECEDGYMMEEICIKCNPARNHCAIQGFELPQKDVCKDDNSAKWIAGAGDPKYVAYAEGFPQGEETGWQIDTLDVMSEVVMQGAILNTVFLGIGPLIKPIAKVIRHPIKAIGAAGKGVGKGAAKAVKTAATKQGRIAIKEGLKGGLKLITTKEGWKRIGKAFFDPAKFKASLRNFKYIFKKPLTKFTQEEADKMMQTLINSGVGGDEAIKIVQGTIGKQAVSEVSEKFGVELIEQTDDIATLLVQNADDLSAGADDITILLRDSMDEVSLDSLPSSLQKKYARLSPDDLKDQIAKDMTEEINKKSGKFISKKFASKTISQIDDLVKMQDDFANRFASLYLKEAEKGFLEINEEVLGKSIKESLPKLLDNVHPKYYAVMLKRAEIRLLKYGSPGYAATFGTRIPGTTKYVAPAVSINSGIPWKRMALQSKVLDNANAQVAKYTAAEAAERVAWDTVEAASRNLRRMGGETAERVFREAQENLATKELATIATKKTANAAKEVIEKTTTEISERLEKNFAKVVDSGRYSSSLGRLSGIAKDTLKFPAQNKRYIAALGIATLASYADGVDEKYASVGINNLAVTSPSMLGLKKRTFELEPESKNYFIRLDKGGRDDAFTSRFYFASPCKTDLDLRRQVCICAGENTRIDDETGQSAYYLKIKDYGGNSAVPVKNVVNEGTMKVETIRVNPTDTRSHFNKYINPISKIVEAVDKINTISTGKSWIDLNKVTGGDDSNTFRECGTRSWWDEQIGYYNNINTKSKCVSISTEQSKYTDYNNGCNYCYTGEQWGKTVLQGLVLAGQIAIEMGASALLGPAGTIIAHLATGAGSSWIQHEIAEEYKWPTS